MAQGPQELSWWQHIELRSKLVPKDQLADQVKRMTEESFRTSDVHWDLKDGRLVVDETPRRWRVVYEVKYGLGCREARSGRPFIAVIRVAEDLPTPGTEDEYYISLRFRVRENVVGDKRQVDWFYHKLRLFGPGQIRMCDHTNELQWIDLYTMTAGSGTTIEHWRRLWCWTTFLATLTKEQFTRARPEE